MKIKFTRSMTIVEFVELDIPDGADPEEYYDTQNSLNWDWEEDVDLNNTDMTYEIL